MKTQHLRLNVLDLRKPPDSPQRERWQSFTNHRAFLAALATTIKHADADIHEKTVTTITMRPPGSGARDLFEADR